MENELEHNKNWICASENWYTHIFSDEQIGRGINIRLNVQSKRPSGNSFGKLVHFIDSLCCYFWSEWAAQYNIFMHLHSIDVYQQIFMNAGCNIQNSTILAYAMNVLKTNRPHNVENKHDQARVFCLMWCFQIKKIHLYCFTKIVIIERLHENFSQR